MSRRRTKPSSPEEIARRRRDQRQRDLEAVNLPADASDLPNQADIEVTRGGDKREGQKVSEDSARRLDAFAALKVGMAPGAFDAARRYEEKLLIRRGENDRGPASERVDKTAGFTTDAMIDAAVWIEAVNAKLPPRDWWLLMELLSPTIDRGTWRATVAYVTGETHEHSQGAAVRAMAVNVRDAAEAVDTAGAEARKKAA